MAQMPDAVGVPLVTALHSDGPAMFLTELNMICALSDLLEQKATLDHAAAAADSEEVAQIQADIQFYNGELTPLSTHEAAVLAAAARPNVQQALNDTSLSPQCCDLLSSLLSRIDAVMAKSESHCGSSNTLQAQPHVVQSSPEVVNSSPSSASAVTARYPTSSSSNSTSPQSMSSPESELNPAANLDKLLVELANRVRRRTRLAAGADMNAENMRAYATGKKGLKVIQLPDGKFQFEVKVGTFQPIPVNKALARLLNEVYVKGTTNSRLDSTDAEEAWALAQLVSEYRDLRDPAESRIGVKRRLKVAAEM